MSQQLLQRASNLISELLTENQRLSALVPPKPPEPDPSTGGRIDRLAVLWLSPMDVDLWALAAHLQARPDVNRR
jgi:hypothetical protein